MALANQLKTNAVILENEITQLVKKFLEENGNCMLKINTEYLDISIRNEKAFVFNKVEVSITV